MVFHRRGRFLILKGFSLQTHNRVLTLGSKTRVAETSFGGLNLLKVCGNCGEHDSHDDYPDLFVQGDYVGSFILEVGHGGYVLNVGSKKLYLDVEV